MKNIVIIGNPNFTNIAGGAENQLIKLAQELAKTGYKVFVGSSALVLEKSNYYTSFSVQNNWATPRGMISLFQTLRKLQSDVLICRVLDPLLIIYAAICKIIGAKLIYFSAHDWELTPRKDKRVKGWRWQLFRLGLQFTSTIFVQNETQYCGFRKLLWWGKTRVVISKNLPLLDTASSLAQPGHVFTWIGTYRPHKNPEWVIKIAQRLPDKKFQLVLHCRNNKVLEAKFRQKIKHLNNIIFTPGVNREQILNLYEESAAVLITSKGEGFPNIAIEAWSQGRAVITTPSNVLASLSASEGVIIAQNIDAFVKIIDETSMEILKKIGQNGNNYFKSNYSVQPILENIQKYL